MDVFDLRYMKRIQFTLKSIGAWPAHVFEDFLTTKLSVRTPIRRYGYTSFLFTICCIGMVAQALYLTTHMGTLAFVDLGQTWLTLLLCCVYTQRTMLPLNTSYQTIIKEFATKFNLIHHKNNSDFSAKMYNRVNFICEIATIIGHLQIYSCTFSFNMVPLYGNYKAGMLSSDRPINGTFEHSVRYVLPVDQNGGIWCLIVFIYNFWVSYNLSTMFCCHDLQLSVFVFHIWGHLKIFEHNLKYFPRPRIDIDIHAEAQVPWYTNEENKEVAVKLKQIIKHYLLIRKFVATISDAYSLMLFVYHGFELAAGCIILLEVSSMSPDTLRYGIMASVAFQQLIQTSVVFELIGSKGDSAIDEVYSLPWECMDNGNRRTVLMLLQIVQQPLSVKACGMVPVGFQTMTAILKASFSYFLMLRTFANN